MPPNLPRSALLDTSKIPFCSSAPGCSSEHLHSEPFRRHFSLCLYHTKPLLAPGSLPRALADLLIPSPLRPSLLGVQNKAQHIKRKLRELETHVAEGTLGLVAQDVRALAPEAGDGFSDREVGARGVLVDIAGVCDFGKGGGGDEVDLAVGEGFEGLCIPSLDELRPGSSGEGKGKTHGHAQLLGQGVHFGMLQQLRPVVVDLRR